MEEELKRMDEAMNNLKHYLKEIRTLFDDPRNFHVENEYAKAKVDEFLRNSMKELLVLHESENDIEYQEHFQLEQIRESQSILDTLLKKLK